MQPTTSSASASPAIGSLCPNCRTRPADTPVSYEETLFAETRVVRVTRMRNRYSSRALTRYGNATLCAMCAAAYRRCVALRANGRRLANIGFAVMLVAALVYLFLSSDVQRGALGIVVAGIVAIGILMLLTGLGMYAIGRVMRRSAARFVGTLK